MAGWYTFLAVVSGIAAGVGCILGLVAALRDTAAGIIAIVVSLVLGAISVVTLLAFAEGIRLAIDLASDVREIRDRLAKGGAEQEAAAARSHGADSIRPRPGGGPAG
jgi:hypothetical protein